MKRSILTIVVFFDMRLLTNITAFFKKGHVMLYQSACLIVRFNTLFLYDVVSCLYVQNFKEVHKCSVFVFFFFLWSDKC